MNTKYLKEIVIVGTIGLALLIIFKKHKCYCCQCNESNAATDKNDCANEIQKTINNLGK